MQEALDSIQRYGAMLTSFMQAFRRPVYPSVTFKLRDASDFEALKDRIENDPRLTRGQT